MLVMEYWSSYNVSACFRPRSASDLHASRVALSKDCGGALTATFFL